MLPYWITLRDDAVKARDALDTANIPHQLNEFIEACNKAIADLQK